MGIVKVYISNQQKAVKIPSGLRLLIRKCCHAVLEMEGFGKPAEVSVTFVDNNEIQTLNREYRHKDAPTDVLSFPLGENGEYDINEDTGAYVLGDVVISMEKAVEQAERYGHSLSREVGFLTEGKPDIDAIAIGPNCWNFHSPSEMLQISSARKVYQLMCHILSAIH